MCLKVFNFKSGFGHVLLGHVLLGHILLGHVLLGHVLLVSNTKTFLLILGMSFSSDLLAYDCGATITCCRCGSILERLSSCRAIHPASPACRLEENRCLLINEMNKDFLEIRARRPRF